jgi:hypothetical protein
MCTNGAVFYDHSLDRGNGFTNPNSMVYDANGRIKTAVQNLASLNESALTELGEAVGGTVRTVNGTLVGSDAGNTVVTTTPGQPTPRTIPVEFGIISSGSNVFAMETAVTSGGWAAVEESIEDEFDVLPATKTLVAGERHQVPQ